jgi:N6-L-threonylcarbamoyladenine synthase
MKGETIVQADVAASFQKAVVDVLVARAVAAAQKLGETRIAVAGGVAANSSLRSRMKEECEKAGITLYYPSPVYCTDNAAMIAVQGYYEYVAGKRSGWDLNAVPNLKIGQR